jgi:pilus assembly protein CpaE
MPTPPPVVHYHDAVPGRRPEVLTALAGAGIQARRLPAWPELPADCQVALVGVADPLAAWPAIAAAADRNPAVPIVALVPDADPATLLAAVRSGARDAVSDVEQAIEAVQRVWVRRPAPPPGREHGRPGRTVAIFALKGGVGKTTIAANLAIALQRAADAPVTAVDFSLPCGNLDMYLDVQGPRGVADLLAVGPDLDPRVVRQAMVPHPSGVNVLSGVRPETAGDTSGLSSRPLLDCLSAGRGITVVDVGAFLDEAQVGALEGADLIIVPISPLISSAAAMPAIWDHLAAIGVPADRVLPVLNHPGPDGSPVPPATLEKLMRGPVRHSLPWGGVDVARSLNEGRPLIVHARRNPLARAIAVLADDVLARLALPEPVSSPVIDLRSLGRRRGAWDLLKRLGTSSHVPA